MFVVAFVVTVVSCFATVRWIPNAAMIMMDTEEALRTVVSFFLPLTSV